MKGVLGIMFESEINLIKNENRGRKKGSAKYPKTLNVRVSEEMFKKYANIPNYSKQIRKMLKNKSENNDFKEYKDENIIKFRELTKGHSSYYKDCINILFNHAKSFEQAIGILLMEIDLLGSALSLREKQAKRLRKRSIKTIKIPLGHDTFPNDFYQSEEWILRSIEILKRDNFKCQLKGENCLEIGNIVHHIRSAKNYPKICLDPKNLVCACKNCHDQLYKNYF